MACFIGYTKSHNKGNRRIDQRLHESQLLLCWSALLLSRLLVIFFWCCCSLIFFTFWSAVDINDDDDTASEDESEDEDEDNSDIEVAVEKAGKKLKPHMSSEKPLYQKESSDEEDNTSESDEEEGISESDEDDESDLNMSEEPSAPNASKVTEKDLMQRVLQKVVNSSKTQETVETQPDINPTSASPQGSKLTVKKKEMLPSEVIKESAKKFNRLAEEAMPTVSKEDSLKRTVFVRNLPLDAKVPDMHRQFSAFGEVKSFRLVLHPITK